MRMSTLVKGLLGALAWLAACSATAATYVLTFPELTNPPSFSAQEPFPPQPPIFIDTVTFTVPPGERVVAATISGFWGSTRIPEGTAGVDVVVDGVLVARCEKPHADCWERAVGQRPWSYIFAESELKVLNDGVATMTALQTSDISVQLGVSTLIVQTGPGPSVPALSTAGLLALMAALAAAGAWIVRRFPRA